MYNQNQAKKSNANSQAYLFQVKPAFPPENGDKSQEGLSSITSSVQAHNNHYKISEKEVKVLNQRIEYLQRELEQVNQLFYEQQSIRNQKMEQMGLQNEQLRINLQQCGQNNEMVQRQLIRSEKSNHELSQALQTFHQQHKQLQTELEIQRNRNIKQVPPVSSHTNQQQAQINRLNDEISSILQRFHLLNQEYAEMQNEKQTLTFANEQLLKTINQYKQSSNETMCQEKSAMQEEILLLKEQINNLNEISIRTQEEQQRKLQMSMKRAEGEHYSQNDRIEELESELKNKNKQIRILQLRIMDRDRQIGRLQSEIEEVSNSIFQENEQQVQKYRAQIKNLEQLIEQINTNNLDKQKQHEQINILSHQLLMSLNSVKSNYETIQQQVKQACECKDRYAQQVTNLNLQITKLRQDNQNQLSKQSEFQEQSQDQLQLQRVRKLQKEQQLQEREKLIVGENQNLKQQLKKTGKLYGNMLNANTNLSSQINTLQADLQHMQRANDTLQAELEAEQTDKKQKAVQYRELVEQYKAINQQMGSEITDLRQRHSANPKQPKACQHVCKLHKHIHNLSQSLQIHQQSLVQQSLKTELNQLRISHQRLSEQHRDIVRKNSAYTSTITKLQHELREYQLNVVDSSSLRSQNNNLARQNRDLHQKTRLLQSAVRDHQQQHGNEMRLKEKQYVGRVEIMRKQIVDQYNVLLRNRGVRINPEELVSNKNQEDLKVLNRYSSQRNLQPLDGFIAYTCNYCGQTKPRGQQFKSQALPMPPQHSDKLADYTKIPFQKIQYHPDVRHLKEEILAMNRKMTQNEQISRTTVSELEDIIHKLKAENEYHRRTIDEMHANHYGLANNQNIQSINCIQVPVSQIRGLKTVIDSCINELQLVPAADFDSQTSKCIWLIKQLKKLFIECKQSNETLQKQSQQANKLSNKLKIQLQSLTSNKSLFYAQLNVSQQKSMYWPQRQDLRGSNRVNYSGVSEYQAPTAQHQGVKLLNKIKQEINSINDNL